IRYHLRHEIEHDISSTMFNTHHTYPLFFFNHTSPPEIYTLSLHDALPILAGIRKLSMAVALVGGIVGLVATGELVQAETLTIGAAHSLKAPFQEILPMFEKIGR